MYDSNHPQNQMNFQSTENQDDTHVLLRDPYLYLDMEGEKKKKKKKK